MRTRIGAVGVALALCIFSPTAQASGIDATRISLPKGPASIEGLGRNFVPSLSSGTSSYGIDIAVPPAVAGFGPKLSLDYDSGGGVSELGMGWKLGGLPSVRRRTENGLPKFDSSDAFEVTGLGVTSDLLEISANTFRPEQEGGAFIRVKRSTDGNTWEVRDKSGFTYRFGGEGCTESENGKVATWLLCERDDLHGHKIAYSWDTSGGIGLLQSVTWNTISDAGRLIVQFAYESRPDTIERYSPGIKQTLSKRISRVDVLHGKDTVRSYALTYDNSDSHSRLVKARMTGADGMTAMPDLSFDYTKPSFVSAAQITAMTTPPGRSTLDKDVTLADLNGDSLPDLLVGKAGSFISYLNHDGTAWKAASAWAVSNSPSVSLSSTGVQLADIDGDGAIDLVIKSGTDSFRYLPAVDDQHFGTAMPITTVPNFTFEDPDVRLADMDGDRRTDVVITTSAGLAIGYNLNGKDWTVPQTIGVVDAKQTLRFSDGHTQICDINGDRVQDLCYLRSGGLIYYLGRGRGVFEPSREATGVPEYDVTSPWQLIDLNGDGWVDLVHAGVDQVDFALASSAGVFGTPNTIAGTPSKLSTTQIEFADMNGSGTTDIVWIDVSGSAEKAWQYLELFPNGRAGLLKTIDNGLGKVTRISYAAAARGAATARDKGTPWTTRMNVGMPVVSEVRLESALGDPAIVTDYTYNNGTWDPSERTFAGFGEGIQTELGDSSTPTLVTESTYDTGVVTRIMRGQPLTSEQRDTAGTIFSRSTNGYTLRDLETALDGRRVHYAFKSSEKAEHIEGKDTSAERVTLTEWEQDNYGNITKESKWGEVVAGDKLAGNDESVTVRTYANNPDDWLLGYLASEEIQDANRARFKLTRNYYDGTAFTGLPLGQVARGDLTRAESWISGDYFANEVANQFDSDGNVTASINAHGGRSEYEYDSESHAFVVEERMFPDIDRAIEWHAKFDGRWGAITEFTTPNGARTSVKYDALGRITNVVSPGDSPDKPTTAFEYRLGTPTSVVTTRSRERSGEDAVILRVGHVDGFGRRRADFQQAARAGQWILSGLHQLDTRGQVAFTAYPTMENSADVPSLSAREGTSTLRDALGRELYTRYPDGAESRLDYAPLSTTTWDENDTDQSSVHKNTPTTHNQDGLGRTVSVIERESTRSITTGTYAYTPVGSVTRISDALGHPRTCGYDGRGRRVRIDDPNGGFWELSYTDGNDLELQTDPTGNAVRYSYDHFGRPLEEWHQSKGQAEELATEYHYDEPSPDHPDFGETRGMLAWLEDAAGREYYGYDARGRSVDTIRRWRDGTEHHTWNDYDSLGRVTRRGFPDKTHLSMAYDARGLLAQLGPFAKDITWMAHGALEGYKLGNGLSEMRTYDNRRRMVTMSTTNPKGEVLRGLRYGLDAASRIVEIADLRTAPPADEDLTASFQYDDRYRLTSATYRTGATTWQHDDLAKILSVKSDFGDPHLNVTNAYGENGAGPDALTHHGTEALSYDAAGRITKDGERSYEWDAKGRLAKVTRGTATEEYVYGHDDTRAVKRTTVDGKTEVTRYIEKDVEERNGRLVRYAYLGGQRLARLDQVDVGPRTAPVTKTGSVVSVSNGDNTDGRAAPSTLSQRMARAWRSASGIAALISLLFACLLVIANKRTQKAPAYVLRLGTVAIWMGLLSLGGLGIQACASDRGSHAPSFREQSVEIAAVPDGAEFYLADAQQSPLAVVSKTASVLSRTALHPFGHVRFQAGKSGDPWGFVGNEEDRGSGISDFHARPYRAELGVFLAVDPLALLSLEKTIGSAARLFAYAYAASDPITQSDPNGLTFGDFARGMWDQGVESAKNAAKGAYSAAKSTAAQALRGDIAGAGIRVVKGVAGGLDGTIENVVNFGGDFAKAVTAPSDYESGRLAVKPVMTAMGASALILGPRAGSGKGANASRTSKIASAEGNCSGSMCPCFVARTPVDRDGDPVAIERIQLGDRVGPESAECGASLDLRDWQEIGLRMVVPSIGGTDELDIQLLRPRSWLDLNEVVPGGVISIELDELNVAGNAFVTYVRPHAATAVGTRCPVSGTIRHWSFEVITVFLADGSHLDVTSHHRLFSADRHDWAAAGDLTDGERLETRHGTVAVSHVERAAQAPQLVFNLEVLGEHQYYVGHAGVRAHNQYSGKKPSGPNFDKARHEAFEKAGMTYPSKIEFSKMDPNTGTVVEFKGPGGAKVGYDGPHPGSPGPYHDQQHISVQSAGKRGSGGAIRENIPYSGTQHPSRPSE